MKRAVLAVAFCLLTTPAFAQVEIVAAVKNDLVARHVELTGPCGGFEITKRVAWALRSQGYGLLAKPGGNNCQGYSVDYLTLADGSGFDILGDGGGENIPQWGESEPPGALTGRWRAPFDPGDVVVPNPGTPAPISGIEARITNIESILQFDAEVLKKLLDELRAHEAFENAEREKAEAFRQAVGHEWAKFGKFIAKYGPIIVGALFGGKAIWGK